jgi:hypothetical protein
MIDSQYQPGQKCALTCSLYRDHTIFPAYLQRPEKFKQQCQDPLKRLPYRRLKGDHEACLATARISVAQPEPTMLRRYN